MTGRLAPRRRDELDDAGKELFDRFRDRFGDWIVNADGGLHGPFNAGVTAAHIGRSLSRAGIETSFDRRLRELAIITTGAKWKAEFEWFAHAPMARECGIAADVIEAIGRGETPSFARDDEGVVYAVARQLASDGRIDDDTYAAARDLLGEVGVIELVALCGYYALVSFILNAFEVPLPPGARPQFS